jgi:hypothetical protein
MQMRRVLIPSPGIPGEGREGVDEGSLTNPLPKPSPGVPGEGESGRHI